MRIIGIEAAGAGTNNQIRGLILEGSKGSKVPCTRQELLKDTDGKLLDRTNYDSDAIFAESVRNSVNLFCRETKEQDKAMPEFIALPYNHAGPAEEEATRVDMLSKYLKESFKENGVDVKTMVVGSRLYDYENVDLINVGKHQLSNEDENVLKNNPKLAGKVSATLGVPSNLSWLRIKQEANSPLKKKELNQYKDKFILFSLGGKSEDEAIQFTMKDAQKLLSHALKLRSMGENVVFVNSPRTPNDVTDYLYKNCKRFKFGFYNSKTLASQEEAEKNFRVYHGKYNQEFEQQAREIGGNIYPAILKNCKAVVNTHDSFSYTSDAAVLGIPSIVYTENEIDAKKRPDCGKLFQLCQKAGYVVSLDDAIETLSRGEEVQTKKMQGVNGQILSSMKKTLNQSKTRLTLPSARDKKTCAI